MAEDAKNRLPRPTKSDRAYVGGRGLLAIVPLGSLAAELMSAVIEPPVRRRQAEWLNDLAERLRQLEEEVEGFKVADLTDNEQFTPAALDGLLEVMRTHEQEKVAALRNAVVNVAVGVELDSTRQQIFIRLVGDFTPLHLKLLHLSQDPERAVSESEVPSSSLYVASPGDLVEAVYPELVGARDLYKLAWSDLYRAGLTDKDTMSFAASGQGPMLKRTTELGDQFIAFVTDQTNAA